LEKDKDNIVFLKDYWREEGVEKEGGIYALLEP
jgi:hypothetical protein